MNIELQEVVDALHVLNDEVNKAIFSQSYFDGVHNVLKKFNIKVDILDQLVHKLSLMNLDFNDDNVVNVLIAIHQSLSRLVILIEPIHNATGKMVGSYRKVWHRVHNENESCK